MWPICSLLFQYPNRLMFQKPITSYHWEENMTRIKLEKKKKQDSAPKKQYMLKGVASRTLGPMCPTFFRYAKMNIYNFLINSNHILVQITFNVDKRL